MPITIQEENFKPYEWVENTPGKKDLRVKYSWHPIENASIKQRYLYNDAWGNPVYKWIWAQPIGKDWKNISDEEYQHSLDNEYHQEQVKDKNYKPQSAYFVPMEPDEDDPNIGIFEVYNNKDEYENSNEIGSRDSRRFGARVYINDENKITDANDPNGKVAMLVSSVSDFMEPGAKYQVYDSFALPEVEVVGPAKKPVPLGVLNTTAQFQSLNNLQATGKYVSPLSFNGQLLYQNADENTKNSARLLNAAGLLVGGTSKAGIGLLVGGTSKAPKATTVLKLPYNLVKHAFRNPLQFATEWFAWDKATDAGDKLIQATTNYDGYVDAVSNFTNKYFNVQPNETLLKLTNPFGWVAGNKVNKLYNKFVSPYTNRATNYVVGKLKNVTNGPAWSKIKPSFYYYAPQQSTPSKQSTSSSQSIDD